MKKRAWMYRQMDPLAWEGTGLSPVNSTILSIVVLSILAAVLQSEKLVREAVPFLFDALTALFAVLFTVEYVVRLWAMGEN